MSTATSLLVFRSLSQSVIETGDLPPVPDSLLSPAFAFPGPASASVSPQF